MKNPNELTIENSVVVLIDHQPWVAFGVKSIDPGLLINNVAGLAQSARDLGVPVVLTTVGAHDRTYRNYFARTLLSKVGQ